MPAPTPDAMKRNRRSSVRRPVKRTTKVSCRKGGLGLGPDLALAVLDVSETGIRLVLQEALKPGQEVEVALEGLGEKPFKALASVVWSVPAADGRHCAGLHVQKSLPYRNLHALAYV